MKKFIRTDKLVLTEAGANFVISNGQPISSTDFTGYIVSISDEQNIKAAINLSGKAFVFSMNPKIINNPKKHNKVILKTYNKLIETGFLTIDNEPFPEFSLAHDLPIDATRVQFIEEPIFITK